MVISIQIYQPFPSHDTRGEIESFSWSSLCFLFYILGSAFADFFGCRTASSSATGLGTRDNILTMNLTVLMVASYHGQVVGFSWSHDMTVS